MDTKLCVNCKHYEWRGHGLLVAFDPHRCRHPKAFDPVTGASKDAQEERRHGKCGPLGVNFEPALQKPELSRLGRLRFLFWEIILIASGFAAVLTLMALALYSTFS